jgi:hypothetical protein
MGYVSVSGMGEGPVCLPVDAGAAERVCIQFTEAAILE